ncbi:MAG: thiol peroxidase [Candidatus Lustribacter sp.]|jgi:thiol peroxidase
MTTSTYPERPGAITFRGTPMTLVGTPVRAGDPAPDFQLTSGALAPFTLKEAIDAGARNALFIAVPSLDTPTCSIETNTFNKRLGEVPAGTAVFVVSADLPFAQNRWAAANGAEALTYLSDYRQRSFGTAYGILIKELLLLARANFVVGKNGTVTYAEIVPEVATEPNYDATLAALKHLK